MNLSNNSFEDRSKDASKLFQVLSEALSYYGVKAAGVEAS